MSTTSSENGEGLAAENAPTTALTDHVQAHGSTAPALLPLSVDARGFSLGLIATIAGIAALYWGQKFFIPLVFGILISYTLNPLVNWLQKLRFPRVAAVTVVMALVI